MRQFIFFVGISGAFLLAACNRHGSGTAPTELPPVEQAAPEAVSSIEDTAGSHTPATGASVQPAVPPAPIVEGMYVIYTCDDGTQPKITFSGNLVKVELTAESTPAILSARASPTSMSDTYSDDTLTLHRDGLGITLDLGAGKSTRCTEREASA